MMDNVGVIGCGQMGAGIAEVLARAGCAVTVIESSAAALEAGKARIEKSLGNAVAKDKITQQEADIALEKVAFSTELIDLRAAELVLEAIVEDEDAKSTLFADLNSILAASAIVASNTSSIPIARLGQASGRATQVIGMHFFNPVPVMPVVEVIRGDQTSDAVVQQVEEFIANRLRKTVVHGPDRAGFIVNALLIPYLLSAIRFYEQGLASKDDIDKAMELGCNLPMGPLRLADFIGLDTVQSIANVIYESLGDSAYEVPALLREMIHHGQLGKKCGRGFYDYKLTK